MDRAQLDAEWAQLAREREAFELEKAKFAEERANSGIEYKLFVGNLDENTTKESLSQTFMQAGTVKEVILLTDREGKSKKSCFVKFFTKKESEACIAMFDGKHKDGNSQDYMAVRFAKEKNIMGMGMGMGGMRQNPAPMNYGMNPYQQQQQQQQGFVGAQDFQGAGSASMQANGYGQQTQMYSQFGAVSQPFGGHMGGMGDTGGQRGFGRGPAGANLYVNNLAVGCSEDDLYKMFAEYGNVVSTKVFTSGGFDHGYGFVSYDNAESAKTAIDMLNGINTGNSRRPLEVSIKKEKNSRFNPY